VAQGKPPAEEAETTKEVVTTEGGAWLAKKNIDQLRALVNKIEEQESGIQEDKAEVEDASGHLAGFGKVLETFAGLMEQTHDLDKVEVIGFTVEKNKKGDLDLIREKLDQLMPSEYEIFSAALDKHTLASIVACSSQNVGKIRSLFSSEGVQELALPGEFANKSLKTVIAQLKDKKTGMAEAKTHLDEKMQDFGVKNYWRLRKLRTEISDRLAFFGEIPKFAETKFTFVMTAWLPKSGLQEFKEMIHQAYQSLVVIEELHIDHHDHKNVPIILNNKPWCSPYQTFMGIFKPPAYGGLDPTGIMAVFFPILFGMILGDVGYGLLIVTVSYLIWKKNKDKPGVMRNVGYVYMMCGISTIVWGILFGEFMGNLGEHYGMRAILPNREKDMIGCLMVSVCMGFVHIVISFIFKAIQGYKEHPGFNAHVKEGAGTALVLCMAAVLIVGPGWMKAPAGVVLFIGIVLTGMGGGIAGVLEIMGAMGNIMSYARIMAIGLSSVIFAVVANIIFTKVPSVAMGLMIAVLLHFINLVLGVWGPTIHGLRLNFLESFGKFVKFDGRVYQPFRRGGEK
jgi:V/A-type H+-transporting ATPase subunit I